MIELVQQCLTDARYALNQCREWGDYERAGDALELIVERLEQLFRDLSISYR